MKSASRFRKLHVAFLLLSAAAFSPATAQDAQHYRAELSPLNSTITGADAAGEVTFTVVGNQLTIRISATGLPPSIEHLAHIHGFAAGDAISACPDATADANADGIIDLIETEPLAGTTMIPFHDAPATLEIVHPNYPVADAAGALTYEMTVPLDELGAAFATNFGGQELDLDRRVVFVHGVAAETALPATVKSLGDIPAQVTLPIACGQIEPARN